MKDAVSRLFQATFAILVSALLSVSASATTVGFGDYGQTVINGLEVDGTIYSVTFEQRPYSNVGPVVLTSSNVSAVVGDIFSAFDAAGLINFRRLNDPAFYGQPGSISTTSTNGFRLLFSRPNGSIGYYRTVYDSRERDGSVIGWRGAGTGTARLGDPYVSTTFAVLRPEASPVPLPSTGVLLLGAFPLILLFRRRRAKYA